MISYRTEVLATLEAKLEEKNEEAARLVEARARQQSPVDTGHLMRSITHESDASGFIVGTNVPYAIYQELGTRYILPNAFLVPALTQNMSAIAGIYAR